MKLSNYLIKFFKEKKIKHFFLNNGGAISFLADDLVRSRKFKFLYPLHEQSSAMMNDAVSRITNVPAVRLVTSGSCSTNLIKGIACAWFDSIPSIFITSQVNSYEMKKSMEGVRQVGFQETDIVNLTKSITKFSHRLKSPNEIVDILPKAYELCTSGRGGPIVIDIPLNFQKARILLKKNNKIKKKINYSNKTQKKFIRQLKLSKKPVLLLGHGARLSKSSKEIFKFTKRFNIPLLTTWGGKDVFNNFDKNFYGSVGVYGNRYSNLILQNSDLIISLGSRMDTRVTSGLYKKFGINSKIISVEIDKNEIFKIRRPKIFLNINLDIKDFLKQLQKEIKFKLDISIWKRACKYLKNNLKEKKIKTKNVNPENFFESLSEYHKKINYIFADTGAHLTWAAQHLKVSGKQRFITSFGHSTMGFALPAAIGSNFAKENSCCVSINGDCSVQLNIQELSLIKNKKSNIKIFVFNNYGYGIIRQFQDNYLKSRHYGTCEFMKHISLKKISSGFDIPFEKINNNSEIKIKLKKIFSKKGTIITEVMIDKNHKIVPKIEYGNDLENMSPKLNQEQSKIIEKFKDFVNKI